MLHTICKKIGLWYTIFRVKEHAVRKDKDFLLLFYVKAY
jgi:hypothetical protein